MDGIKQIINALENKFSFTYINLTMDGLRQITEAIGQIILPTTSVIYVPFVTEWNLGAGAFTLPAGNIGVYDCWINWGDNTPVVYVDTWNATTLTHNYAAPGVYKISIYGTFPHLNINNGAVRTLLLRVMDWGNCLPQTFQATFYGCTNLTTLPDGPITGAANVKIFDSMFRGCSGLLKIPAKLLWKCGEMTSAMTMFRDCTNVAITTIPTDFLKYNTKLVAVNSMFYNMRITSVPATLFTYNILINNLDSLFKGCISLITVPAQLFKSLIDIVDVNYQTFMDCTALTSIPIDLFKFNTKITGFMRTFRGCTSLPTLPADIFKYNILVTTFNQAFNGCTLLATIPPELFRYNVNAYNFTQVFDACPKLTQRLDIFFNAGEEPTRFDGQTCDFSYAFRRTNFTGLIGDAPALWNCTFGAVTHTDTWEGVGNSVVSLNNYGAIPVAWL